MKEQFIVKRDLEDQSSVNNHMKKLVFLYDALEPRNLEKLQAQWNKFNFVEDSELSHLDSPIDKQMKKEKRRRNSSKNSEDKAYDAKVNQIILEDIRKNDYLFFLLLTGNIEEYLKECRKFFGDLDFVYEDIDLIDGIKRRFNAAVESGYLKKISISTPISSTDPEWQKRALMMDYQQRYFYYDNEIKRVTREYHEYQYSLVSRYYDSRDQRIDAFLNRIDKDIPKSDPIHTKLAPEIKRIKQMYKDKRGEIKQEKNLETRHRAIRDLEEKYASELQSALREYIHDNKDVSSTQQLEALLNEEIKVNNKLKTELATNDTKFTNTIEELSSHQKLAWKESVKEIDQDFDKVVDYMKNNGRKNLSQEQNVVFSKHLSELVNYQKKLKNVKDPDSLNEVLVKTKVVLAEINELVKPTLDKDALPRWNEKIGKFEKISYKINEPQIVQEDNKEKYAHIISEGIKKNAINKNELKSEIKSTSMERYDAIMTYKPEVKENSTMKKENIIDFRSEQEQQPGIKGIEKEPDLRQNLHMQQHEVENKNKSTINYKSSLKNIKKKENNITDSSSSDLAINRAPEVKSFDKEQKKRCKGLFEKISDHMAWNYPEDDSLDNKTATITRQFPDLIDKATKEIESGEANLDIPRAMFDNLKELKELRGEDNELGEFIDEFNTIFEFESDVGLSLR